MTGRRPLKYEKRLACCVPVQLKVERKLQELGSFAEAVNVERDA
jgi:hypothetical protein